MNSNEQGNEIRERNRKNKQFIQGLQDFLGGEWKLQYKNQTRKVACHYFRHVSLRVETKLHGAVITYCNLNFPDLNGLQIFDLRNFELALIHFNECKKGGIRQDFYERLLKYKEVMTLKSDLEAKLSGSALKPKALKV